MTNLVRMGGAALLRICDRPPEEPCVDGHKSQNLENAKQAAPLQTRRARSMDPHGSRMPKNLFQFLSRGSEPQ